MAPLKAMEVEGLAVNFESFNEVLKHPIRRRVIFALAGNKSLSYVELLNITETSNTGKFNYHLKILGDLIAKDENGKYYLTEKGQLALEFLQKFPEKKLEPPTNLHLADAALIGLAGFAFITVNPAFLIGAWISSHNFTVPVFTFVFFAVGSIFWSLIVPSFVMRFLALRRTRSHDMYSLFRAPLFTVLVLGLVLTVMFLTGIWKTLTS